jgi:AAA+ ATPase superfamily predicted ATPase
MFSDPVVGDDFFGRQDIVDLLVKRASALKSGYRQNVAIIGHQQLGKTSVLRQFIHVFRDPQILPIYVEIKFQQLDYFVDQFARALLFQYLTGRVSVEPTESLASLSLKAQPLIPKTVERIAEIASQLKHRHAEDAYVKLFELTHALKEETGMSAIVILDEFHRLGEFGIKNAFSDFGKRIMVQKDTMYILSSSSFSQSKKILAEKLALLFGHFERVYLEAFDFDTSFQFIRQKMDPARVPPAVQSFIVSLADGHPFFMENLVSRLREICLSKGESEAGRQSVAEACLKLFYESQGVLNQYFSKLISPWTTSAPPAARASAGRRGNAVLILTAIANGKNRLKDIAQAVNRGQRETGAQLEELIEHELIVKNGVFYRFHSKTFRFWLKEVYQKKELSLLGTSAKSESFVQRMLELMAEEESLLSSDVSLRLIGLLSEFKNDRVELGEKKRVLPHFSEFLKAPSASAETGGSARRIIARGGGRCWICKVTEEKATEREVLDLVQGNDTKSTKVLLALRGLDDNARLLAKEKRVLALGLSRINLLMDLYGKSPIIQESQKAS